VKRVRRIHTVEQMRAALRSAIRESGMSQAEFARKRLNDSPESLSLSLTSRGLSRRAQKFLGVKREIMYRDGAK
jgi:hypothetical protein